MPAQIIIKCLNCKTKTKVMIDEIDSPTLYRAIIRTLRNDGWTKSGGGLSGLKEHWLCTECKPVFNSKIPGYGFIYCTLDNI